MGMSIRYDLGFQEALLRFADDQIESQSNPNGLAPTHAQEEATQECFALLCDAIDHYAARRVEAERNRLRQEASKGR